MPSVEVPLGDFFGITHGRTREYGEFDAALEALAQLDPG